jgi:hypothetical protein
VLEIWIDLRDDVVDKRIYLLLNCIRITMGQADRLRIRGVFSALELPEATRLELIAAELVDRPLRARGIEGRAISLGRHVALEQALRLLAGAPCLSAETPIGSLRERDRSKREEPGESGSADDALRDGRHDPSSLTLRAYCVLARGRGLPDKFWVAFFWWHRRDSSTRIACLQARKNLNRDIV